MNGLQQLIDQWQLLAQDGEFRLYTNPTIALANYVIVDPTPAIVSLEVFRAIGYTPPFTDQPTAEAAMGQLIAMGGSAAIPGILAQSGGVPPIAPAPITPVPIDAPPVFDYTPPDTNLQAAIIPPIEAPPVPIITEDPVYPSAEDYAGASVTKIIGAIDTLLQGIRSLEPIADSITALVATIATDSIAANPIGAAIDPGEKIFPCLANKKGAEGFRWYVMIGDADQIPAGQAISKLAELVDNAGFTRRPKLNDPEEAEIEGFGAVWYLPVSYAHAEKIGWQGGAELPTYNM
jgi:hypothetical protein